MTKKNTIPDGGLYDFIAELTTKAQKEVAQVVVSRINKEVAKGIDRNGLSPEMALLVYATHASLIPIEMTAKLCVEVTNTAVEAEAKWTHLLVPLQAMIDELSSRLEQHARIELDAMGDPLKRTDK